jgi:hypothetical protein
MARRKIYRNFEIDAALDNAGRRLNGFVENEVG